MRIVFLLVLIVVAAFARDGLEKVSVQMSWKYQFEYAGFIAAIEKGYYRDAGMEVELREYKEGMDIISEVLEHRATYGVYNSSIIVENGRLKPIILLATYFQHSPLVFVARKGIKSPADMIGKTIMGTRDEFKYSSLALLMEHFGVTPKNARIVDHTFRVDDFISGKVDVMSAFRSNQLYYLDKAGIDYEIIDPAEYGFVMSAVNLYTSPKEAFENTERTRRFIEATNRGWKYALENPDEIIELLLHKYHSQKTREALRYEARTTQKLMMTDFYPVGQANAELTIRAYKQLLQNGTLKPDQKLGTFMFDDILASSQKGVALTPGEKEYLLHKKKITMCVDPEWYPLEAIRDGKHIGIAADVMKRFEHKLALPIELVPTATWDESLLAARNRKCDILSLAGDTPERHEYLDYTSPYLALPLVMVTDMHKPFTEDINTLQGEKIGVVKGYATLGRLREHYPQVNIVEVESITEGLKMVESGELYGYIDNLVVVSAYIQKQYTAQLKVSSRLEEQDELKVAVRNDEPELQTIFEKLVLDLDEQTMQEIYNRWLSTVEEVPFIDFEKLWKVLGIVAVIVMLFGWRYFDLKRYNARLLELSITDKLTGLYNRQKTDAKLVQEKSLAQRHGGYHCSIMLIDVDLFKHINDTYGHQVGDAVLQELAQIFRSSLRISDVIGRWGGEEFMVILPHTGLTEAVAAAENLRHIVEDHRFESPASVTISIGVGELDPALGVHENIGRIDSALYRAKSLGRNRIETT